MQIILLFSLMTIANILFLQESSDNHMRMQEDSNSPPAHEIKIEEMDFENKKGA